MFMYRLYSILFIFLFMSMGAVAQVLENYNGHIQLNEGSKWLNKIDKATVKIDVFSFPQSSIRLKVPGESTVLLDEKVWLYVPKDTLIEVEVSHLQEIFSLRYKENHELAVLKDGLDVGQISVVKGYFPKEELEIEKKVTGLDFSKRNQSAFDDFFILGSVIILFLFAIFKIMFPQVLGFIIRPQTVFSAEDFSDTGSLQKFFSLDVMFYILLVNHVIALVAMLFMKEGGSESFSDFVNGDINVLFFNWFSGAILLTLVAVVKFLFLKIMVFIFGLQKFDFAHFFYLLRIVSISLFVILGIGIYFFLNDQSSLQNVIEYSLIGFFWAYLLGVGMMFLIMLNRVPFKNYHLFAYICTAELIPFLILSKLVIG
jgi:hypothetical protein